MELMDYRKLRTGLQVNAAPAGPDAVRPLARRVQESLQATGLFADVEVDTTENVDAMVIGMCTFPAEMQVGRLAHWIEQLWQQQLRYGFWEAHTLLVDDAQVEFLGATRSGLNGHYVTLHFIAQRASIPVQRGAADAADSGASVHDEAIPTLFAGR
ncbi:MAG: regulator of CtrA degradation [Nocardioidaceae bacterium]|jgi:hypothetical protein|nr:regulator of CtrA degradation [Nocardioidaceae bacterium]